MRLSELFYILFQDKVLSSREGHGTVFLSFVYDSLFHVSISQTLYEQLLCQNPFTKKLHTQIESK